MSGVAASGRQLSELSGRLRERRPRLEEAALARACDVADPDEVGDPEYGNGLRAAVSAAVGYGLAAIDRDAKPTEAPPEALLLQARLAARNEVSLDTVLRRYLAGHALLSDCLIEEAGSLSKAELKRLLRREIELFDRLLASISEAYAQEERGRPRSAGQRRVELVRMLLAGGRVDSLELGYELEGWHVGMVAAGPGISQALRDLAAALDQRLLAVSDGAGTVWAWLGGRHAISAREVLRLAETCLSARSRLGLGETGQGVEGWRRTHHQAKASMSIAMRGAPRPVAYADVALLASALKDDVLLSSLRDTYLAPLESESDGGAALRKTLYAYFEAGCQVSSAAAALGVARQTVSARLRSVEEKIERPVGACSAELKLALHLSEPEVFPRALR